jgi:tRNA(Arg) A34 adenosine deaminase TadA
MSRDAKIINLAAEEALKSTQTFRHGAVITKGSSKVVCLGYNKGNRTKVLNNIFTCMHAEMDALNKLVNCILKPKYGRDFKKHCKKYSIWVTRLARNGTDHLKEKRSRKNMNHFAHPSKNTKYNTKSLKTSDSKPCFFCCKLLKEYGIKRVFYTNCDNKIEHCNISDLISTHKSDCQLKAQMVSKRMN